MFEPPFQAFATLTQISAKVTTSPGSFFRKKPHAKPKSAKQSLCTDSFTETLHNCDFAFAKHLNLSSLFNRPFLNNFHVSFVSNETFFQNKHGFAKGGLTSHLPTLVLYSSDKNVLVPQGFYQKLVQGLLVENKFTFNIQTRGFKTDRSIQAELERNPTIMSRLKNNLAGGPTELGGKAPQGNAGSTDAEQLKKLLSTEDSHLTDHEKQRIKIAFAEGYLVGNSGGGKTAKASKYFRVVQQVLTIAIFFAIVVSLMASASGSVFR